MIIESLTLYNFGVFEGKQKIDFPKNKDTNIMVFIGKNGSGKTTILEALKIALYGPLLFGYKTVNDSYLEEIKDKINNNAFSNKKDCSLNLKFEKIENSENIDYEIIRRWKINTKSITEELKIYRRGVLLSELEKNILENYLRQFLPPSLIDLFFFDGEKLSFLTETNILQGKLKKSIDIIFNIEIFSQLIKDLNQFLKQKEIESELSDEERKLRNKREDLDEIEQKIEEMKVQRMKETKELQELSDIVFLLKNEMSVYGALEENKLIELKAKYKELEREKEKLHKQRRNILTTLFPFQISRDLLLQLQKSIKREIDVSQIQQIKETLNSENLLKKAVEKALMEHSFNLKKIDELSEKIICEVEKNIPIESKNSEIIHHLTGFMSKEDIKLIDEIVTKTGENLTNELQDIFKEVNRINTEMLNIRKKINLNLENTSFEEIFEEIDKKRNEQFLLSQKTKEIDKELERSSKEKKIVENEIENLDKQIDYINRKQTVSSVTNKIIKVSSEFIKESRSKKIRILEERILVLFEKLIRKKDLVKSIRLLSDYEITFQNGSLNSVQFKQISTGEKQVFIIAILWALIQLSQRTFPVVFDSFFGRLDLTHKNRILTKFVPNSQKQVILLVNDNEINSSDIELFSKYNTTIYSLKYNEKRKNTSIESI